MQSEYRIYKAFRIAQQVDTSDEVVQLVRVPGTATGEEDIDTVHYPLKVLNQLISLLYNQTDQISRAALLQKLSTPSDYSVSDNGCAHQMALKNNSVRQGVLMVASGWKRLPWLLSEK